MKTFLIVNRGKQWSRGSTHHYYTTQAVRGPITKINQSKCSIAGPIFSKYRTGHCPLMIPHLCLCSLCSLQSCNKSVINQACSEPYRENIGPRSFSAYFLLSKAGKLKTSMARVPYNKLLTNLASSSRTGEYWSSVVFVRTERSEVRTKTTEGQYSPVRLSRSVSKRLIQSILRFF